MRLSVIIPARNEGAPERNFEQTLNEYYKFLSKKLKKNFEIGIIVNNSTDTTIKIADKFVKTHPMAWVHEIKGYSGKGGAVMRGFDIAKGDVISFVDADNSTTVYEFWNCYKSLGTYEGVIASRRIEGANVIPKRNFIQGFSSWLFNKFVRILFRMDYKDTQCGCKIFKKDVAKFLVNNYTEPDWNFDVNLLNLCDKNNFIIREYPINWTDTIGGKVTMTDGIKNVFGLIKYKSPTAAKFLKFCLVGGMATLIDFLFFNAFFIMSGLFVISRIMGILISMIFNFSSNKYFTFKAKGKLHSELIKYVIVYGIAMGANVFVSKVIYSLLGEDVLNANIAAAFGLIVSIPTAFFGSLLWAFKKR
jgi:putative flippase GtrA